MSVTNLFGMRAVHELLELRVLVSLYPRGESLLFARSKQWNGQSAADPENSSFDNHDINSSLESSSR